MTSTMYEIMRTEYKGLGVIATKDIKKGSLILSEYPQMPHDEDVLALWESYEKMPLVDQNEYMTLHNKYDYVNSLPWDLRHEFKSEIEKDLWDLMSYINQYYGHDPEKVCKIFKIYNIYRTNYFDNGVSIQASRLNHSCRPNAICFYLPRTNSPNQIRAISDIKRGEEITISYVNEYDYGMRNRKFRRETLLRGRFFICTCDLCENGPEDNDETLQELMNDAEKYHKGFENGRLNLNLPYYPLEMCRREISCYRKIYKIAMEKNMQQISMFKLAKKASGVATLGFRLYNVADLKWDAENFARAADRIGRTFGVTLVP